MRPTGATLDDHPLRRPGSARAGGGCACAEPCRLAGPPPARGRVDRHGERPGAAGARPRGFRGQGPEARRPARQARRPRWGERRAGRRGPRPARGRDPARLGSRRRSDRCPDTARGAAGAGSHRAAPEAAARLSAGAGPPPPSLPRRAVPTAATRPTGRGCGGGPRRPRSSPRSAADPRCARARSAPMEERSTSTGIAQSSTLPITSGAWTGTGSIRRTKSSADCASSGKVA